MQNSEENERQRTENGKPIEVTIFGIGNIIIGCYSLVKMAISWSKVIADVFKNPPTMAWTTSMLFLLLFILIAGFVIWLIVLGYGLLTMKRWARRGSIIYAWIMIIFMVLALGGTLISSLMDLENAPRILKASMTVDNGLAVLEWIYMVLLLIFMKTNKVKRVFAAAGEYVNL
jgi:hypothetical protein